VLAFLGQLPEPQGSVAGVPCLAPGCGVPLPSRVPGSACPLPECPCRGPVPAAVHVPFADVAQMRLVAYALMP